MAKYSFDLKLKAVIDYEQGLGSYQFIADKYHVETSGRIKDWVDMYQTFGSTGLQRKRKNTVYDTQFKLNAVNLYLTSEKSYREITMQLGMTNRSLLARWVLDYRARKNTVYDTQFKLNAVNLYLTSEKSYREITMQLGMTNRSLLARWVLDYGEKSEFAFSN